jgi:hypothetical protein
VGRPPNDAKLWLTAEQEQLARRLLADGVCHRDVAYAIGVTYRRLLTRTLDQLADAKVGRGRGGGPRRLVDPTPAEIATICQEIQAGWSDLHRAECSHPLHPNFSGGRLPE